MDTLDYTGLVAVGTPVTRRPPHRSQRAELPHWAPTSGLTRRHCLPYPFQRMLQVFPPLSADPVLLDQISLGQSPFLHFLRRPWRTTALVRKLLGYYETVRLPMVVHHHRAPLGFLVRTTVPLWPTMGSPVFREMCFDARTGSNDRAGSDRTSH